MDHPSRPHCPKFRSQLTRSRALGSFVGAYGVGLLNGMTGSSGMSYLMMAAGLVVTAVLVLVMPKRAPVPRAL